MGGSSFANAGMGFRNYVRSVCCHIAFEGYTKSFAIRMDQLSWKLFYANAYAGMKATIDRS